MGPLDNVKIYRQYSMTNKLVLLSHTVNLSSSHCKIRKESTHVSILLECDKVFWVGLGVVEYDKDSWAVDIVDHRVIENVVSSSLTLRFIGRDQHSLSPLRELPCQNATPVNSFLTIEIWGTVSVVCRVVSI